MHVRPSLHPRRGPLHFRLWLWEKRISHLQRTLHRYHPSCQRVQPILNVPRSCFWHRSLPQQYWPQILNIRYVLRSKVIQMCVKSSCFILCFLEELLQKSTAMNMGALVLKNASEYIQEKKPEQNVKTKWFLVLARKEKFVQPTVSWTRGWANATNTTSAQTGSEVSPTFSPCPSLE